MSKRHIRDSKFSNRSLGRVRMLSFQEIQKVLQWKAKGWSQRQAAKRLGINRRTVRRYWDLDQLADGEPWPIQQKRPNRVSKLQKYKKFLEDCFNQHAGNCDVVRQRLKAEKNISVPLRTLQHFMKPYRQKWLEEREKNSKEICFIETPPGSFLQIDFGSMKLAVGKLMMQVHLFVATLGYSRRIYVEVTENESQNFWLRGIEDSFRYFGGKTRFILCDNAKALVFKPAAPGQRQCTFNDKYAAFCSYWRITPIASMPRYPQSKGKVERMVQYVKNNALRGYEFESFGALQGHLEKWLRDVSDERVMRNLPPEEEPVPRKRFEVEKKYLKPADRPSFLTVREEYRRVDAKALLTVDNEHYQLPATMASHQVRVQITDQEIRVFEGTNYIQAFNKSLDAVKHTMFDRITDGKGYLLFGATSEEALQKGSLDRDLLEYEEVAGGSF